MDSLRGLIPISCAAVLVLAGDLPGQGPEGTQERPVPSFLNEVQPLLTRLGCNQGACHGKSSGQNGFRLSLRAFAPEWDHHWLTREFGGRRINRARPEESLLLQKPLGRAPHAGGVLFAQDSRAHRLLLDWIGAGAPGADEKDTRLEKLEIVSEGGRLKLKPGENRALEVRATFASGTVRDVTWLTQFDSNDASVATVTPEGRVTMVRPGETAVRASFLGQVAVIVAAAPHDRELPAERFALKNNFIDEHVFRKLADLRIEPSRPSSDEVFLRRVYLDAMGILPEPAEVRAFLADQRPDRRARWIDQVLERPEFVDFQTMQLAELLQNRKESDHDVRGTRGVRSLHAWLRRQVAENRPWDRLARDILTAAGDTEENPAVGYYVVTVGEHREAHRSTVVASVAQTFLGTRIGCAQCHNHPSEKYTQDDYYHFSGFFSRISFKRLDPKKGPTTLIVSHADRNQNKNPVGVVQPRTGKFLPARPLDREECKLRPDEDPRAVLAGWIVDPNNEYFAGAMVNRLWKHFFGLGLVEPVDDLRASNPPSNPDLWKALTREFAASRFDRKHLIRLMLNSRAYQLSAKTLPTNEKDQRFFSRYYARRLPAEVLLDALAQATAVPDRFEGYPVGLRAVQIPDPAVKNYFLGAFGRNERITACACERNNEVTLPQLLHLIGGESLQQKIASNQGRLAELLRSKKSDADIVEELYLAALGRRPRQEETKVIADHLARSGHQATREELFRDVFWALANSKEFSFNH